jgi:outer membrane protein assembly factor BamE (lipoprotein component of BamABCDE complex)
MTNSRTHRRAARQSMVLALALSALALGACAPTLDQRGNLPDPDDVLAIEPGVQSKEQVAQLLGTPSTVGTFDDKTWYYISKRTETVAFFSPSVLDQQVLVIKFDNNNMVQKVDLYGLDDAQEVSMESRETPTFGQKLSIIQQLFGNIGRFSKGETKTPY